MVENEVTSLLKSINSEMLELKKYLRFLSLVAISDVLNKVATTPERQQIWRLADGERSTETIASQSGVSLRTVQYFVQEAENLGLIINEKRGFPKRIAEIIPKEWKPWKPTKEKSVISNIQPAVNEGNINVK